MNSPFLFDFVSKWRFVPSVMSIMTLAPSTGCPCTSLTTPLTIPVDCAAAGCAIVTATSTAHPASHGSRPFNRRTMEASLKNENNSRVEGSLHHTRGGAARREDAQLEKNASTRDRSCTSGAGGSDAM